MYYALTWMLEHHIVVVLNTAVKEGQTNYWLAILSWFLLNVRNACDYL